MYSAKQPSPVVQDEYDFLRMENMKDSFPATTN